MKNLRENGIMTYNPETNKYEYEILITEEMKYGIIKFDNIKVEDYVNNISWSNMGKDFDVTVLDKQVVSDVTAPIISKFSIDKNQVTPEHGMMVNISLQYLEEQSGVEEVRVFYIDRNDNHELSFLGNQYDIQDGKIDIKGFINNVHDNSDLKADKVVIKDYAGNENIYKSEETDLSSLDFKI